jgi:outer membrane protein TolC
VEISLTNSLLRIYRNRPRQLIKWPQRPAAGGAARAVLLLALAGPVGPLIAVEQLSVSQALALATQRSGKLGGAKAAVEQTKAQVEATQGLGGPIISVAAIGYRLDKTQNINLQPYASNINNMVGSLPISTHIPTIPSSTDLRLQKTGSATFVNGLLPLYTGGRVDGMRGVVEGRAAEALANEQQDNNDVRATLLQRYFAVQVLARVSAVREAARLAIAKHLETARRMESAGLIAKVDRMQAEVAHDGALRDASKARHDLALARRGLAAMVDESAAAATLVTPLFVDTRELRPLETYLAGGQNTHPGLAVVRAKRAQTTAANMIEDGVHKPSIFAFGVVEPHENRPDWMIGVAVNWVLIDGIDRSAVVRSGHAAERRVDEAERQARQDIALLVEQNYRNLDQAKVKYLSLRSDDALALEYLRLRERSLSEGLGTALDLIDAQLNLAKVQTEQASAAYDYSQALAALLASVGEIDQFSVWAERADIQLR